MIISLDCAAVVNDEAAAQVPARDNDRTVNILALDGVRRDVVQRSHLEQSLKSSSFQQGAYRLIPAINPADSIVAPFGASRATLFTDEKPAMV